MKKSTVAMLGVVAATLASPALAMSTPSTFQEAYQKGAEARIGFKIIDDLGLPVSGATVNVFFDMVDRGMGRRIIGETDTNGVYVAEAKTMGVLEIKVSREGYYSSTDRISFIDMGREHEVKGGRWQPWGMQKEVVLRPVRMPKAIRVPCHDWLETKAVNQWIGFDLEGYDFVAPVGNGRVKDFDVRFDWDGMYGSKYNGMAVTLRFNSDFAGGYSADKTTWSKFTGVYCAKTNAVYSREFRYERYPVRDAQGRIVGGVGEKFDQSKVLVGRSRCVLDANGNLVSARYFQISGLQFSGTPEGRAGIRFTAIYNPTPNDPNLEPK